jgi:hypothetical protein
MLLQPIVASLCGVAARCRFDDDRANHVRVQIAEVLVGPRRGEGERIAVVGVERLRFFKGAFCSPNFAVASGQALLVYCLSPTKAVEQNGFRGLERAMATFIPRSEVFPSQPTFMRT